MTINKISPNSSRRVLKKKAARGYNFKRCAVCQGLVFTLYEDRCWECRYAGAPECAECQRPMFSVDQRHPDICGDCFQERNNKERTKRKNEKAKEADKKAKFALIKQASIPDSVRVLVAKQCKFIADDLIVCPRNVMRGKDYCWEHAPHYDSVAGKLDAILDVTDL